MWVFGFYMWHLSLTTKLSEFIMRTMVILRNENLPQNYIKVDLGPLGNKLFLY